MMALFRGVRRVLRRRLLLFFVLIMLATVFLCGLEVLKYKRKLSKPGLSGSASRVVTKHHLQHGSKQQQRHDDAKDSKFHSLADGSRENYGETTEDENEDVISDKRIESDDEISIEEENEEKENEENNEEDESLGEYEDDLDSVDRNNKEEKKDMSDDRGDHKEDEEELEEEARKIVEQEEREEEGYRGGEQEEEEEEFGKESKEETNEEEKVKQHAEEENEELKQELHVDEKHTDKTMAVSDEESEYFPHNREEEEGEEEEGEEEEEERPEDHRELDKLENQDAKEEERHQEDPGKQEEQDEEDDRTEELENRQSEANTTAGNKSDKKSTRPDIDQEGRVKNETYVKVNKETVEPTEQKENGDSPKENNNVNGEHDVGTEISKHVELENEQKKDGMKNEDDKSYAEEGERINEDKTKRNESEKDQPNSEEKESEENKDNEEKEENVEGGNNSNKTKSEDENKVEDGRETNEAELPSSTTTLLTRKQSPTDSTEEQEHGKDRDNHRDGERTMREHQEQDSLKDSATHPSGGNVVIAEQTAKHVISDDLLRKRQEKRRDTMNRFCQKHKDKSLKSLPSRRQLENLVVVDRDEIIYCAIPKVASTEWREALSVDLDLGHDRVVGKKAQNRTLWKHLNEYSIQNITDKLQKYKKFLFVREPFGRLLSAYKSKFVNGNEYYYKTFGRPIINQFRKNATEHAKNTGDDVTFFEFLKHIVVAQYYDEHWRPYDDLCHVCSVQYDFIGHLETIDEDAPFLLREFGIDHHVSFKSRRRSQTSSELLKYYSQIPVPYIERMRKIYSMDFEMFGYPFPGPLKSLVEDSTL